MVWVQIPDHLWEKQKKGKGGKGGKGGAAGVIKAATVKTASPGKSKSKGSKGLGRGDPWPDGKKVSKTIGWLNKSGELQAPIDYSEVADALALLGDELAGGVLYELGENAATIRDPTAWLKGAIKSRLNGGGMMIANGGGMMIAKGGFGKGGFGKGDQWIAKHIGWLNADGILQQHISYSDASAALQLVPETVAHGLLKELREKAAEVKDPTAWLCASARKFLGSGSKRWRVSGSALSKKVGELNQKGILVDKISWSDVVGPLTCMDEAAAVELIDKLEAEGDAIKNPTNWLKAAAEMEAKRSRRA